MDREEMRNAYNILVRKHEGKRPLRRPLRRWEVNITMNLREIGWTNINWTLLAQDKDDGKGPSGSAKCGDFVWWVSNS
jgi:hypothetical protein